MPRGRRETRDLTALTVLALLATGPRHPYELHRIVVETHKDFVTGGARGLYHAVGRLERDELVTPVETRREGRRPERTVYTLTDEGRAELRGRVAQLLERPDPDTRLFVAAVSFLPFLTPERARECLVARVAALEGQLATLDAHTAGSRLPRLVLLENAYVRAVLDAELEWVRGLVADLDSGAVSWPDDLSDLAAGMPGATDRPS